MPVSPETLLRRVRQHHFPDHPIPRVVGVDDWAFHKGHRYRILLVDLERHKPIMYITETIRPGPNGTSYHCVLLRQSYREEGKVKNRTIANLSHCTPQEVEAIRLALQHKDDLAVLSTCPPREWVYLVC